MFVLLARQIEFNCFIIDPERTLITNNSTNDFALSISILNVKTYSADTSTSGGRWVHEPIIMTDFGKNDFRFSKFEDFYTE